MYNNCVKVNNYYNYLPIFGVNSNASGVLKTESVVGIQALIRYFFPEPAIKFSNIEAILEGIYPV